MTLNCSPFPMRGRRTVLLAEGDFSTFGAKTAVCYLRYRTPDVVAVVDGTRAGMTAQDAVGFGGAVPVVADVARAVELGAELAVVGMAPRGGQLAPTFRRLIEDCLRSGLDVASGLHTLLSDDPSLRSLAQRHDARIWDVRAVPEMSSIGTGRGAVTGAYTVLVTGSDCNVGKMTATVELVLEARRRGIRASWAATGQTGIMLRGQGIAIDRVIADFTAGATEELVNAEGKGQDILFVEGQGSLVHPGYGGVTLGLVLGAMPDGQILVHAADHETIGDTGVAMPPLGDIIDRCERATLPFKKSPVLAVALNTAGLDAKVARDKIDDTARITGLPVTDPVRLGAGPLLDAVVAGMKMWKAKRRQ